MNRSRYNNLEDFKSALQQKGIVVLDEIYLEYKAEFFLFAKKYNMSNEDLCDVYQDTIIAFYENVINGKLTELSSSLKTYIFSIGKYGIYNKIKKESKLISLEKEQLANLDLSAVKLDFSTNKKSDMIRLAMEKLGGRCKRMLILFYYHSYSIEALMQEFKYKNENVVRSHKSRCLKNLKTLVNEEK
ncbi:RNA polymerase sigma factor [Portibacter lacus]|uniref:RNA polymerase sigma factor n=1 Tax=Portibacter lacus TaxID=1099794 RepID=UPI001F23397D|nr:sigma-70 family RNA polymerase sigma factor [Portibacter lacus]